MAQPISNRPRVTVDGKFFRRGAEKFFIRGVTYGPFAPNAQGEPFASPERTAQDFALVRELGANLLRIYNPPPRWFLDLAAQNDLLLLMDVPWFSPHSNINPAQAREAVRRAVTQCAAHPAVFAFSVVNEITPKAAQKFGVAATVRLIEELIAEARRIQPDCFFTFANYPPSEFLQPRNADFACFNIYLHDLPPFQKYLAHAQILAGDKPLLLGETGIDSQREGEARKCEILSWQIEHSFRSGLVGAIVFSFTDDWFKDGRQVEDWALGLTTGDRQPKESFYAVQKMFRAAPRFPLPRTPKVSVLVASYNGGRTLESCLASLAKLNYPDYEIILVDDGSTDSTPQIAAKVGRVTPCAPPVDSTERRARSDAPYHPLIYIHHKKNLGLSAARNTGIAAATGEIIAFTDSDCRVDEDWLYYLVADVLNLNFAVATTSVSGAGFQPASEGKRLVEKSSRHDDRETGQAGSLPHYFQNPLTSESVLSGEFVGVGGPNLLPPEDSALAAAVMASPGGPVQVMLGDREAEHIPGCNMAFTKRALTEIGGFDPIFTKAGDDVDLCWRLQRAGFKIGFSPAAVVWHHRRETIGAYLRQQRGYGEAEALLARKHPQHFNRFGNAIWRGKIYSPVKRSFRAQTIYAPAAPRNWMIFTKLEFHAFVTLPLMLLSLWFAPLAWLAAASLLLSAGVCMLAGARADLPPNKRRWWSRPLVALLFFLQPIVRRVANRF
jgi:GT2 family glycosyltransferase